MSQPAGCLTTAAQYNRIRAGQLQSGEKGPEKAMTGTNGASRQWEVLAVIGIVGTSFLASASVCAAEQGAHGSKLALPLVIPQPQAMHHLSPQTVVLGEGGVALCETVFLSEDELLREAGSLIDAALKERELRKRSVRPRASIVLAAKSAAGTQPIAAQELPALTAQESAALARSEQAYVIRMSPGEHAKVWIIGASPLGTYYGATTLVQLMSRSETHRVVLPHVGIQDYPDIPYRMCADWVLTWDWEVNGYDWGDGLEAFVARCRRKIDLCARFKVNRVRFLGGRISPGPAYMKDRYERIKRFALELNRYARRKQVALQFSSSSWGLDYYGWGLPCPQPWILNRESYPDGAVYSCVGGTVGGCLSNDDLIRIIARRQRQLVEDVEPGSIYLHHIDAARYSELAALWKSRCARCRQRFPDEEPRSARGYAGAVAALYNRIVAELKAVKNPASGYDASRDLEIVFASPGYSYWTENDAEWENELAYFAEIGRQLADKGNVQITFREQYHRLDNRGLRISEMSRQLEQVGWPNAPFVFAVQGGGFLDSYRMFVSSPVLASTFRNAATLYFFNGHAHCELQVLANANYAWNHRAAGAVDPAQFPGAALREEASRYSRGLKHSDYLYGHFLDTACKALYGDKAAPYMAALFRFERQHGPIWPLAAAIDRLWGSAVYDWQGQAQRNLQAKQLVQQAATACDTDAKADLLWLSRCLEVTARICLLCDALYREKAPKAAIDAQAAALLGWLDGQFQFQIAEPDGGDPALWKDLIARIRKRAAAGTMK